MREFKFRAWDHERERYFTSRKWVEFNINLNGVLSAKNLSRNNRKYKNLIIEQFTGVKDKNGVEIYEGDIVKVYFPAGYGYKAREISIEVVWRECGFIGRIIGNENKHPVCHHKTLTNENWLYEVIGNIRENSELLESGK